MELEARIEGDHVVYPDGTRLLRVRGGDGTEEPAGQPAETPAPEPAAAETSPPPAASTEHDLNTPFRLEEVPEEYREHVERYINATRPSVTQAFQEAARQRQEAQEAIELAQRLESPETARDALSTLLERYGLELDDETWAEATGAASGGELEPEYDDEPAWARRIRERQEAEDRQAEVQAEEEARQTLRSHMNKAFAARAAEHGYGDGHSDLPDPIRNSIAALASVLPAGPDGLPNAEGAQEMFDAAVGLEVERILRSKTPDPVPAGGGPGERRIDVTDPKDRLALSEEIAARAFSGTAS